MRAHIDKVTRIGRRQRIARRRRYDAVTLDPDPVALPRRAVREPLHRQRVAAPPFLAHLQDARRQPGQEIIQRIRHVHHLVHLVGHEGPVARGEGTIGSKVAPVLSAQHP